jgi:hypothetical protein
MELTEAVERVSLGESIAQIASAYREGLLADFGLDPKRTSAETFRTETRAFCNKLCRRLGDLRPTDKRSAAALVAWLGFVDEYDAYDSLLTNFRAFEGRTTLLERGRRLFPGPLTAHWDE